MSGTDARIEWAGLEALRLRDHAEKLRKKGDGRIIFWVSEGASAALEFLARAASGTVFEALPAEWRAEKGLRGDIFYDRLAALLDEWSRYTASGISETLTPDAHARVDAATDLMEQVEALLTDVAVHPAAPVVLAGAALEELLRSLIIRSAAMIKGKPGLNTYAAGLRSEGVITQQEQKDITAWAGQRNEAAHGQFDDLSHARARIMVDGINLFMQRKTVTTP